MALGVDAHMKVIAYQIGLIILHDIMHMLTKLIVVLSHVLHMRILYMYYINHK